MQVPEWNVPAFQGVVVVILEPSVELVSSDRSARVVPLASSSLKTLYDVPSFRRRLRPNRNNRLTNLMVEMPSISGSFILSLFSRDTDFVHYGKFGTRAANSQPIWAIEPQRNCEHQTDSAGD